MPVTVIRTAQLENEGVRREDLNSTTAGQAVVKKIIQGTSISLSSTGVDAGTGDVTINVNGTTVGLNLLGLTNPSAISFIRINADNNVTARNSGDFRTDLGIIQGSKTYNYFTSLDNNPPASNYATLDTRNSIAVLEFDTTTEESAIFVGIIPEGALLESGLIVKIYWIADTATSGDCRWGVQFEKMTTDLDSDSFDTATEATSTTNATSGIITITSITVTAIDSLTIGDAFRLKIYRDTSDAADTMAGDAQLVAVEVRSAA